MKTNVFKSLVAKGGILVVGLVIGFFGNTLFYQRSQAQLQKNEEKYNLLAKRLFADNPNDTKFDFRSLRKQLEGEVELIKQQSGANVGIYFEYLPTNVSITVNPDFKGIPASMLKTVSAMLVMQQIELGKLSLNDQVTLTQDMLSSTYGDLYKEGVGATFSVEELLYIMLQKSDNTALDALNSAAKVDVNKIFSLLSLIDAQTVFNGELPMLISPESYIHIFKCLYFACFNSDDNSQYLLNILSNTGYNERLTKLLPDDVTVAHKFGTTDNFQSDCGIVYANERSGNYLLCIMINANDPLASTEIARLSYIVYSYVNNLDSVSNTRL